MESRKWYRFSPSPFSGNGKNQYQLKNSREIQDLTSIAAEMTGDSCLARAVAPRAAAAVDHADTELIGHRGWKGTGFLCGVKQLRLRLLFVFMKGITIRHVSNCHFERSEAESRNLLPPCSPLYWPHSIERNAGSFLRKELPDRAEDRAKKIFQKFFLHRV